MSCKHEREEITYYKVYNEFTGDEETIEHIDTYYSTKDLDLHRYQCTQCGEIGYYSKAAHDYYVLGIKSKYINTDKLK